MKHKIAFLFASLFAFIVLSCNSPLSPSGDEGPKTISKSLASLPELKLRLPKSLSLESSAGKTIVARAFGDVTDLNTTNVGSVKSESWMQLQRGNPLLPFLNKAFGLVEEYARQHSINDAEPFSIDLSSAQLASFLGCQESEVPADLDLENSFLVKGQDPLDFLLYAKVQMAFGMTDPAGNTTNGEMTVLCKMHLTDPAGGPRKIEMDLDMTQSVEGLTYVIRIHADIDATTGACTMVSGQGGSAAGLDPVSVALMLTEVGSDGSITDINVSMGGSERSCHVAYGNDLAGGIASTDTWTCTDADGNSETGRYYWGEYYNGKGDIIYRSNGQTQLWAPDTGSATNLYPALGAAPATLYVRQGGSDLSPSYSVSADGVNWTEVAAPANPWDWYWKQGANWQPGDAYYYWQGYANLNDPDTGNAFSAYRFYPGYQVPDTVDFNGRSYYVTKEYPLRNLLPLAPAYSGSLGLKQKEGESYSWSWSDSEGNLYSNDWTSYEYWLENLAAAPGYPSTCDFSDGDISLNDKLSQYDMYYWNGTDLSKVKSYFFRTTCGLPPYFSNPDPSGLVAGINASLTGAIERAATMNLDPYVELIAASLADDPAFAAMTF
jgi:hypothetical protein